MKSRWMQSIVLLCALGFLVAGTPATVEANEPHCPTCEMCDPDTWFCTSCGVKTLKAISGCCGMDNGDAFCVADYGGFAVNCDGGHACQCDMNGEMCDILHVTY